MELRWLYDRRDAAELFRPERLAAAMAGKIPQTLRLVEENIEETFTFYRLPLEHSRISSTNMLERINEELKRRTHVIRIFPNQKALCA